MNNPNRIKTPHKKYPRGAMDGFVKPGSGSSRVVRNRPMTGFSSASDRVDQFRGVEGFRPNAQANIRMSAKTQSVNGVSAGSRRPQYGLNGPVKLDMPDGSGKNKKQKHGSKKKVILRAFALITIVLVSTVGFVFGNAYLKAKQVFKGGGNAPALNENVDPTKLRGEGDGRVNVLLLGRGGAGHDGPDLTDTIMIASIDPIHNTMSLVSIPRDLYVPTTDNTKINDVYAQAKYKVLAGKKTSDIKERAEQAGESAIESKIEQITGLPIHYYVIVDFAGFEDAINTVGGVDINVPAELAVREVWGPHNILNVQAGMHHLDGATALGFARSRHTSARGDFDRSERQRLMLVALKEKVMSAGTYGNPVKITQLVNEFSSHIQSDLSTNELSRVYQIVKKINSGNITSLDLVTPPHSLIVGAMLNGQSIQQPREGATDYSAIQDYLRNTLKDPYLSEESASIAVYNGTSVAGLATKKANELKSFGYNITTVANASDQNYTKTVLVDLTKGQKKYTKHYLEQRLGTTAVTAMPDSTINPGSSDFVIILGNNATN